MVRLSDCADETHKTGSGFKVPPTFLAASTAWHGHVIAHQVRPVHAQKHVVRLQLRQEEFSYSLVQGFFPAAVHI